MMEGFRVGQGDEMLSVVLAVVRAVVHNGTF